MELHYRIMKHGFPEGINFHPDYEYFNLKDRQPDPIGQLEFYIIVNF